MLNKLKTHLRPLQRQGLIDVWHDREISAGTEWEPEIKQHLNTAQIILLLVSPDFMNSEYCYGMEMKQALERHESGDATVIPIILRDVFWHGEPLGKLQALPTDGKPVTDPDWHNLDRAFYNVTNGIHKLVVQMTSQRASGSPVVLAEEMQQKATKASSITPTVQQARKVSPVIPLLAVEKRSWRQLFDQATLKLFEQRVQFDFSLMVSQLARNECIHRDHFIGLDLNGHQQFSFHTSPILLSLLA